MTSLQLVTAIFRRAAIIEKKCISMKYKHSHGGRREKKYMKNRKVRNFMHSEHDFKMPFCKQIPIITV